MWTCEEWDASSSPNGVAVVTDACSFVLAFARYATGYYNDFLDGNVAPYSPESLEAYPRFATTAEATSDYSGLSNTDTLLSLLPSAGESDAILFCSDYTFPNGQKGYVGAAGEWGAVRDNYLSIVACLLKICLSRNPDAVYSHFEILGWSSTYRGSLSGSEYFWALDGSVTNLKKSSYSSIVCVSYEYGFTVMWPFTTLMGVREIVGEFTEVVDNLITIRIDTGTDKIPVIYAQATYAVASDITCTYNRVLSGMTLTLSFTIAKGSKKSPSQNAVGMTTGTYVPTTLSFIVDHKYHYCKSS